jgi:hypothetical protein
MAKALKSGYIEPWFINFLSPFGLYPGSFYPIGGPFILTIILFLNLSDDITLYLFSLLTMFVSIGTSYYLANKIFFEDEISKYWFVLFYTTTPLFLRFSYYTSSLRGPFLAVLPLVIYFNIELMHNFDFKTLMKFLCSLLLLALIHRLVIIYPIIFLSLLISFVLTQKIKKRRIHLLITLITYSLAIIIGINSFPIDNRKIVEFILTNDNMLGIFWNLVVDYSLRIGLMGLLTIIGFIGKFIIIDKSNNYNEIDLFYLILGNILAFLSPISLYISIIVLIWGSYYAVTGLQILQTKMQFRNFFGLIPLLFGIYYSIIVMTLVLYLFLALLVAVFSTIQLIKEKNNKMNKVSNDVYFTFIIIFSIITVSFIAHDGLLLSQEFPYSYASDEELEIAEYLKNNNLDNYITLSYHFLVSTRIQAYSFQPVLATSNEPASIYYGYQSIQEVKNNTTFDLSNLFKKGVPFQKNYKQAELVIRDNVIALDLQKKEDLILVLSLKIKYIILNINELGNLYTPYGSISDIPLFISIINVGIIRYQTRNLILYEIPNVDSI